MPLDPPTPNNEPPKDRLQDDSGFLPEDHYRESVILIVDDDPSNIQLICNALSNERYDFGISLGPEQALKFLEKKNVPDLILLDVRMPKMDGFTLCRKIKSNPQWAQIPVIFLTALNDEDSVVKGFESGGVDYLPIPFRRRELVVRVHTHLELKRARDSLRRQMEEIRMMRRLLPICSVCHKIRNDDSHWENMHDYFRRQENIAFSHTFCPVCSKLSQPPSA